MTAYGDDAGFQAWLVDNGFTLPPTAPSPAVLRLRGSVYVDGLYGPNLSCSRPVGGFAQERAWPRIGAKAHGAEIPDDAIPPAWVAASYRAAWLEASSPGWTSAQVDPNARVRRQAVKGIEREFFDNADASSGGPASAARRDSEISALVAPFLCPEAASGPFLWSVGR